VNCEHAEGEHYYTGEPRSKPQLGLVRVHLRGRFYEFLTSSSVFSRTRIDLGTRLLIESMVLPKTGWALDLGCGYGPVGIVAASLNPALQVMMVDVNARATRLTRANAKRHRLRNVEVRQGSLYEPVNAMEFAVILCNPPVSAGAAKVHAIIAGALPHLSDAGSLQLVVRSTKGGARFATMLEDAFGNVAILARQSGYRVLRSKKS
jgi:16S rRNA (guanine1207-N2)-methyltransferase